MPVPRAGILHLGPLALKTKKSANSPKIYVKCGCVSGKERSQFLSGLQEDLLKGLETSKPFDLPHPMVRDSPKTHPEAVGSKVD